MGKFITHDCIHQGVFNRETCTASNALVAWQEQLVNTDEILLLVCKRLDQDFLSTPKKMRRPWNHQQVDTVRMILSSVFFTCFFSAMGFWNPFALKPHVLCCTALQKLNLSDLRKVCSAFALPSWLATANSARLAQWTSSNKRKPIC